MTALADATSQERPALSLADLVDAAVAEAPQLLFGDLAESVTFAQLPELLAALQGPALRDVLAMRIEQIVKHGHDLEHDETLPIDFLPREAAARLHAVVDRMRGIEGQRDLAAARLGLVRAAAMCLAGVQRLDLARKGNRHG